MLPILAVPIMNCLAAAGRNKSVQIAEELAAKTIDLLNDPSQHEDMKKGAQDSLNYLKGAMDITLLTLETYLETTEEDPR